MATYTGLMPPGPGVVTKTFCFTGTTASAMRTGLTTLVGILGIFGGAVVGAIIGFIVSFIGGPELIPQAIGIRVGAWIGALIGCLAGVLYMLGQIKAGACTCPPGAEGYCLDVYFLIIPGAGAAIPLPIPPSAAPGRCATLVPAGCP